MQATIIFTHDCDECGTEMKHGVLMLDNNEYPVSFLGQMEFVCPECNLVHIVDDINILNQNDF